MASTLLDKVWDAHTVRTLPSGQTQLLIGLHLIHEVTSPQAFQALRELKLPVRMPERTFATLDHIIPLPPAAAVRGRGGRGDDGPHDPQRRAEPGGPLRSGQRPPGIVHVIGPELG